MSSRGDPPKLERLGRSKRPARDLFLIEVGSAEELIRSRVLPPKHFVAMLAWDSKDESVDVIGQLSEHLIRGGCAYVVAWGEGCSRIDDIVDETVVEMKIGLMDPGKVTPTSGPSPWASLPTMMTSGHKDQTLDEVLDFFLFDAWPSSGFEATCGSAVVVTIGRPRSEVDRIRERLMKLEA